MVEVDADTAVEYGRFRHFTIYRWLRLDLRRGAAAQRGQPPLQHAQRGLVEPGSDVTGVGQPPGVHAEQQRAELTGPPGRAWLVPADHQLLAAHVLDLAPRVRAGPGPVRGVEALGDHAFEPLHAGCGQDVLTGLADERGGVCHAGPRSPRSSSTRRRAW